MWPLGHAAVAYLLYSLSYRGRFDAPPELGPLVALAVGSQFPDLVDKPLAWYLGVLPTGRTLAHSLLVLVPLSVLVVLVARRYDRTEYGVAFAVGALSHAALDAMPVLWDEDATTDFLLWPLVSVDGYEEGAPSIVALFLDSLSEPYFLSEFVLVALAFALWRRDGSPGLAWALAAAGRARRVVDDRVGG